METYNGNIGFLFNCLYYQDTEKLKLNYDEADGNEDFFRAKNKEIIRSKFPDAERGSLGNQKVELRTTYPGLVVGLGYGHGIKSKGEFKLGFSFDHTTGLPIIQGSSVKGMIRSAFPNRKLHIQTTEEVKNNKTEYIKWILEEIVKIDDVDNIDIDVLEQEIFDGIIEPRDPSKDSPFLSLYKRDIFYDAVIIRGNNQGELFGEDSITPHHNPLKNPVPLLFMKVLPSVVFQFDFDLHDGRVISAEQKRLLFQQILLDFGIGAKTNVGYGQLERIE